jgi:hypothetical protein
VKIRALASREALKGFFLAGVALYLLLKGLNYWRLILVGCATILSFIAAKWTARKLVRWN